MGTVYLAQDDLLDRQVAIKVLRRERVRADGQRGAARLLREARAMARLAHPNVVAVHEVGTMGQELFIAMEYVEGGTLRQWQASRRGWRDIVDAYVQAGRGLAAAHQAGLVHRDFKPENVLVGRDGRSRVTDFGIVESPDVVDADPGVEPSGDEARPLPPSLTRTGAIVGTPAYMAPEQHRGATASALSDQFSFCVALYEALYRERPFAGETSAELLEQMLAGTMRPAPAGARARAKLRRAPLPGPADGAVPDGIYRLLARGLQARAQGRHTSMATLVEALQRESRPRGRARGVIWAGLLTSAAAVAIAAVMVGRGLAATSPAATPALAALVAPGRRAEFFVDAAARGTPTGDASHPYPSITAALAAARRSSAPAKTIRVAAGTYDAAHETFPLELRGGTSLIGEGATTTTIVGAGRTEHAAGGTASKPVFVSILVGDPVGSQTIRGVAIHPGSIGGQPWGIYCDQGNAYPPVPADGPGRAPNLVLDQLEVTGFDISIFVGTSDRPAPSGCNARITGSLIAGKNAGVFVAGAGYEKGSNAPNQVSAQIGGDGAAEGNRFIGNRDLDRTGSEGPHLGTAVKVFDRSSPVVIRHNTFSDNDFGVTIANYGPDAFLVVDDNSFTGTSMAALSLFGNANLHSLANNFFAGTNAPQGNKIPTCGPAPVTRAMAVCVCGTGSVPLGPQIARARGNVFAGNDIGVYVAGTPFSDRVPRKFDFGTAADPGHNVFNCNSSAAGTVGYDVWLDTGTSRSTIPFAGNGWDRPVPSRASTGARNGTDVVVRPGGPKVDLGGASANQIACPLPHIG